MRPLRLAVLRPGLTLADAVWPGDDDPRAGHYAVGSLAVGSIVPEEPGFRVRGMATAPEARGQGLGTLVLDALLEHAREQGAKLVWCLARPRAESLYERAGFVREGEPYVDPALGPHQRMVLRLGK